MSLTVPHTWEQNGVCVEKRVLPAGGDHMTFGKNLQALREAAGLSQSQLARKCSIPVKTLQNWEIDRAQPRIDALMRLAQGLGTTTDALLNYGEEPSVEPEEPRGQPRREK
jgi:transcriptional regulator with XRE-family HTH domain